MRLNRSMILNSFIRQKKYFQLFFIIFYSVGVIGIYCESSRQFFIGLIPYVLFLSFIVILLFHESSINKRTLIILSGIYLCGLLIEIIGVNTRMIFGNYIYGNGLGIKILNTPLMIGINWLMLVYCSSSVIEKMRIHLVFRIFIAAFLMLMYDYIIEHIAPFLNMWHWENNRVPIQNYIAWFIIAVLFQTTIGLTGIKIKNQIAGTIFACQTLFFLTSILLLNFTR
jgi:bisanhydrobacterioruberin hydratase